jgi:hypothetical protein
MASFNFVCVPSPCSEDIELVALSRNEIHDRIQAYRQSLQKAIILKSFRRSQFRVRGPYLTWTLSTMWPLSIIANAFIFKINVTLCSQQPLLQKSILISDQWVCLQSLLGSFFTTVAFPFQQSTNMNTSIPWSHCEWEIEFGESPYFHKTVVKGSNRRVHGLAY